MSVIVKVPRGHQKSLDNNLMLQVVCRRRVSLKMIRLGQALETITYVRMLALAPPSPEPSYLTVSKLEFKR